MNEMNEFNEPIPAPDGFGWSDARVTSKRTCSSIPPGSLIIEPEFLRSRRFREHADKIMTSYIRAQDAGMADSGKKFVGDKTGGWLEVIGCNEGRLLQEMDGDETDP